MQAITTQQSTATMAATTLANLCAVVLMGVVLAYWTWAWLAPASEPRASTPAQVAGATVPTPGAYAMFGKVQGGSAEPAQAVGALRLLGVVAAKGGLAAYAVIQTQDKQSIAVRAGEDVSPGLRLAEVRTDRVILIRGAVRETLLLPEPGSTARPATPPPGK